MLPKFLYANNTKEKAGKTFIVHTELPRCIIEFNSEDFDIDQRIHWIDAPLNDADLLKELILDAEEFLIAETQAI